MTYKASTWQMRWWSNYMLSLQQPEGYGEEYCTAWHEMVNNDLKNWHGAYTEYNQVEFRSQKDYEWFVLRWR